MEVLDKKIHRVVAIGNFDGLHLGHKKLIERLKYIAKVNNLEPLVYIIERHYVAERILTKKQKVDILKDMGICNIYFEDFTEEFKSMRKDEFINKVLKDKFNVKAVVSSHDFRFGKDREGDVDYLKKFFNVEVVEKIDGISSTNVRKLLRDGNVKEANKLLGREFSLLGTVVVGLKIGGTIGFKTANMKIDNETILPSNGVYKTKTCYNDKIYDSITNIGYNPTISSLKYKSIETNIFDFNENIYGKDIEVYFLDKIRDEKKFKDVNELVSQIEKDIKKVRKV